MDENDLETGRQKESDNKRCIQRVPRRIRNVKPTSYTPQMVSIGPLHHGIDSLQRMESEKLEYQQAFFRREELKKGIQELKRHIEAEETRIKNCYHPEEIHLDSDSFVRMVLLDATYIIELFLKLKNDGHNVCNERHGIYTDLVLLENQLPFFIVENLYNLAFNIVPESNSKLQINVIPFKDLTLRYFKHYNKQKKSFGKDVKHFTDLFRYFLLPNISKYRRIHSQDPRRTNCMPQLQSLASYNESESINLPSATTLNESGVKFKLSQKKCWLDIEFTKGKLKIPPLKLCDWDHNAECIFRNIMALEQCNYRKEPTICDYVRFLNFLIKTDNDVELLAQAEIARNLPGSYRDAAATVNKLSEQITEYGDHYNNLITKLNKYHKTPHRWLLTSLINDYFKTPWIGVSTIAAIMLLVLTAIQTVCAVIELNR